MVNGRKAFYWEKNHKQNKSIILLHGFPGSHLGLIDLADELNDYRLIIPDLPACGLSDPLDKKHNLENYSEWLKCFLDSLSIDQTIIIGHSFGSRMGLVFSDNYPEKVSQLVLITPVVKVEGLIAQFVSIEYGIAKMLPENLQKIWLSNKIHRDVGNIIVFKTSTPERRKELIARSNEDVKRLDPKINIELFDEFYKFSLIPLAQKIKTKSLIIAGELDEIAPLTSVRDLAKHLVNSEFVIMKGCGHVLVAEEPSKTADIVNDWLVKV